MVRPASILALASSLALWPAAAGALPAFDGAEGFGAIATGGRGGAVIKVTTLDESGPGSLREALETSGPRIIVFAVSGVIDLGEPNEGDVFDESDASNVLVIPYGDVTIAGQTAPGGGITIRGRLYAAYDESVGNIVVRHVRIRPSAWTGDPAGGNQYDALRFALNSRVMVDHVSVAFGVDEIVDAYEGSEITVQWSTIEEAATEGHEEGAHNYGLLNNVGRISVHHNLFVHNQNRNPALAVGPAESINNVAYDVRHGFVNHNTAVGEITIVGNYFKQGPEDSLIPLFFDGGEDGILYWLADNYADDPGEFEGSIDDPWSDPYWADPIGASEAVRAGAPFRFSGQDYVPVTTLASTAAYDEVLDCAGAFPRDTITSRVVQETIDREGSWGAKYPVDLLEGLVPGTPPADGDDDGIPDDWESDNGLGPSDPADYNTVMPSGYTAIEEYLDQLADMLACGSGGGGDTGGVDESGGGSASEGGGGTQSGGTDNGEVGEGGENGGSSTATSGGTSVTASGSAGQDGGGGGGCGCAAVPSSPWLMLLVAVARRRRRAGTSEPRQRASTIQRAT